MTVKETLALTMKQRYWRHEPVMEREVFREDQTLFTSIIDAFGSWHAMERTIGLKARHLRERERYLLYLMLKERKKRFGSESLRHKNIEPELKTRIASHFRSVKKLTHMIGVWTPDTLIYETHTHFITGGSDEDFPYRKQVLSLYPDMDSFYDAYERRLLLHPIKMKEVDDSHEKRTVDHPDK